ncbi:MAG: catalase [Burkholderiaceae bacterium]|nr:catalase [Burkholderiaceae bacterium]
MLTTNQGVAVADNQNSLKYGERGPALLEDFILREKITHFDHERIPERIVHARGSGAHGYFECYESLADLTRAAPFQEAGKITPVFARFSTVQGERGSKDTARDVRGFAVKFYTDEGNWDLVGNNMPVFFIQDAMKFPDLVHAAAAMIAMTLAEGRKLMLCGNGGSAADSQHIAAELTGRFLNDRRPLAALALTTDSSALTCIANDYDFDEVFARQLTGLGQEGDCLLAISTSGNSQNVLRAVHAAQEMKIATIGLTGHSGGDLARICDAAMIVPSSITARVQEAHIFVGHVLCSLVEETLARAGLLHKAPAAQNLLN